MATGTEETEPEAGQVQRDVIPRTDWHEHEIQAAEAVIASLRQMEFVGSAVQRHSTDLRALEEARSLFAAVAQSKAEGKHRLKMHSHAASIAEVLGRVQERLEKESQLFQLLDEVKECAE